MIQTRRALRVMIVMVAAILSLSACRSLHTPKIPFVKYYVSGQSITVVSAVTPFDARKEARDAFLHWFKRGFEIGLAGKPPLMIEWDETPKGKAGRRGYNFGMDEGEKYRENQTPNQSPQTIPIPPGEI